LSPIEKIKGLPRQLTGFADRFRKSHLRKYLKFTEGQGGHSVRAAVAVSRRSAQARRAIKRIQTLSEPPKKPYVFFGLHFQPESSIDVWAPFFSNQMWVIELLARSVPPSYDLLVKIHKSDAAHYSLEELQRMSAFPGVRIVRPFADTRDFIENADLIVAIQGTIGLEAALLRKPVIMLGDSPVKNFPSVSQIGEIRDLPKLIQRKLRESPPSRGDILSAYAADLAPFFPAGHNDWRKKVASEEIDGYVNLFGELKLYLAPGVAKSSQSQA